MEKLLNLGPKSSQMLADIGIRTEADLEQIGAVEAYKILKEKFGPRVTLNMLWGLQGALLDIPWNELPPDMKTKLRKAVGQ